MASKRPMFVIVPGASQNPAHYGYLSHLLLSAGYAVFSAILPTVGSSENTTVEDDVSYVRNKMLLPILDYEEHDVILVMHSYSSVPGSAAAKGLGKSERAAEGKKTSVIGQIFIASLLTKGGDGGNILGAFGGSYPPHIRPDPPNNLLHCDDRIPPLYQDVPAELADAVAASAIPQGMTSFISPCPGATWGSDAYKSRIAFIRTLKDAAIPLPVQQMMLDGTGVDWIIKDIDSGHSPQLSQPETLTNMLLDLAKVFEAL